MAFNALDDMTNRYHRAREEANRLRALLAKIHADLDDVIACEDAVVRRAAQRAWELCKNEVSQAEREAQ